jgi:glyoxylase-like metal-dependent hydrolase (beta-lactamase superfamily II)
MTPAWIDREVLRLAKPTPICEGVHQLRAFGAKVTVIAAEDGGVVLVDAGGRGSLRLIEAGLEKMGVRPDQVRLVVLTHNHPDHAGGLGEIVRATGARVAVHRDDGRAVSGEGPPESPFRNPLISRVAQPVLSRLTSRPVGVDYNLVGGERLPYTEDFEVLHTPGHTAGSICLYSRKCRLVIVGDALQFRFGSLGPPAAAVTKDPLQAMASLEALLDHDFDILCFSHFNPLRTGASTRLRDFLSKGR